MSQVAFKVISLPSIHAALSQNGYLLVDNGFGLSDADLKRLQRETMTLQTAGSSNQMSNHHHASYAYVSYRVEGLALTSYFPGTNEEFMAHQSCELTNNPVTQKLATTFFNMIPPDIRYWVCRIRLKFVKHTGEFQGQYPGEGGGLTPHQDGVIAVGILALSESTHGGDMQLFRIEPANFLRASQYHYSVYYGNFRSDQRIAKQPCKPGVGYIALENDTMCGQKDQTYKIAHSHTAIRQPEPTDTNRMVVIMRAIGQHTTVPKTIKK